MLDYTVFREKFANKTLQWFQSDIEDRYKLENRFGPNLYGPESFDYKFNSHGFRCDEFDLYSELPVVFLGCSLTEGEGLPVEKTWAYLTIEKIRKATGKEIPYWNLATSGGGLDTNAGILANYIDQLRPRYIFYLRPSWWRRAVFTQKREILNWVPNFSEQHSSNMPRHFSETFVHEHYALQQADRSLTIIDLLAEKYKTKVFHHAWDRHPATEETIQTSISRLKNFQQLKAAWTKNVDLARDSAHPGPATQQMVADQIWELDIKQLF